MCPSHTQHLFWSLCWYIVTSILGGYNPREATEMARVFYILCVRSKRPQPVILRAVSEEQCRVLRWQHRSTVVPFRIGEIGHQVENVALLISYFDIFSLLFLWTWLRLHEWFKYFLKYSKETNVKRVYKNEILISINPASHTIDICIFRYKFHVMSYNNYNKFMFYHLLLI